MEPTPRERTTAERILDLEHAAATAQKMIYALQDQLTEQRERLAHVEDDLRYKDQHTPPAFGSAEHAVQQLEVLKKQARY